MFFACALIMVFTISAAAKTIEGSRDWKVTFTEKSRMEQNFGAKAISETLSGMEPNDTAVLYVNVANENEKNTAWYMTNKVISSLEDTVKASGGVHSYHLTWQKNGSTERKELYQSDTVGGDIAQNGQGLHEASGAMEEFIYLDVLKKGEGGLVKLEISLDGETQNNAYQDARADIRFEFAVEPNPDPRTETRTGSTPGRTQIVKTGDRQLAPYYIAGLCAGAVLLLTGIVRAKKQRNESEGM